MQKLTFDLAGEFVELNQLLKLSGLCDSGGAGKNLVASGVVAVDGKKSCARRPRSAAPSGQPRRRAHHRRGRHWRGLNARRRRPVPARDTGQQQRAKSTCI